ncbi:hypothetical protein M3Y99_00919800 [Aphelenchoides fujianensis]|nr:hypothetical protein M3Y99_00919800 [Aphelenchoides fujianensis]
MPRRRPEPIKDAVEYDKILRKKKQMLTPEPTDATAARYLELKPRVQALYAWDAHAGLCDAIAAALRAPERLAASAEATRPFARHLVDHRASGSSLATLGDYAEFDRTNAAFRPAADVQPALVWVDTKRGENLLAALFCEIAVERIGEELLVATFRSPANGIAFRHAVCARVEPFAFRRDATFRVAEFVARELDAGAPLDVTLLFADSRALKTWAQAITALNPKEESDDDEEPHVKPEQKKRKPPPLNLQAAEEAEDSADDGASAYTNQSESMADDTLSVGSNAHVTISDVMVADFELDIEQVDFERLGIE